MRTILVVLLVLLCPVVGRADRGYGPGPPTSGGPPPHGYNGPRSSPHHDHDHHYDHHHHNDDWIVPLAIIGGVLGIAALTQMESTPVPPRRLCRDTYNYYDEYGNYVYSRSVDRPCDD